MPSGVSVAPTYQVFKRTQLYIAAFVNSAVTEECLIVGCLALNASFEPLTMVPMRRALRLVIDGKAEIVEADPDRVVRSERLTLPRPVVIRLTRFIHVPRRFRRQVTNTFLFARDRTAASTVAGFRSSSSRASR